ncbi:MAG: Gldg family protein [Blastocatellia bacterium]|nr:Gldg family protein [Blastocatellia bacterium]
METNRQELTKLAGFIGAAALFAGLVRHEIQEIWGWQNLSLAIGGGVLLLASIILNYKSILAFFTGRSGKLSANTLILSVAVLAIMVVLNYMGYRYHKRFDLTTEGLFTLSDQTVKIVSNLQKDVKVIRFDKDTDETIRLTDQMADYKPLSKRFSYERVDPQEKLEIARQYGVSKSPNTVVASGDRIEHLQATDEQSIANAIIKVTRDKLKRVCFVEGHDERSTANTDGDGLAIAEGKLKNENYETQTIKASAQAGIPPECDIAVVAGPKQPFLQPEAAALAKYLDNGGKVMLLIDPETDPQLGEVLKAWNVEVGAGTIIERNAANQLFGAAAPLVSNYGEHPITDKIKRAQTIFIEARPVKVGEASGSGVSGTTILTTSPDSWAETEIKPNVPVEYNADKDQKGPIPIGLAATKSANGKESRLIVVGDSDFATNGPLRVLRTNGDLFLNSINWLAQDEDLISIRPKAATNRSVTMNESQQRTTFWLFVLLMPIAVLGAGVYVWWKRR